MTLAGIDEAGYGPLLGPLAVGLAAFRAGGTGDLPGAEAALRRALLGGGHGVRVGDSKETHVPSRGPGALEATVMAVLAARDGDLPRDVPALHAALGVAPPPEDHPWYAPLRRRSLPLAADPAEAARRGAALARRMGEEGVAFAALAVRVLPEGAFNAAVARTGSKATVLFEESVEQVAAAFRAGGEGPLQVTCDRHGARARYGPLLQGRFPGGLVRVLEEGRRASAYSLDPGGTRRIRFVEGADAALPAVGLASILAKYLREVWMGALNGWILAEAPEVRPTAGYWSDGQRFLRETEGARRRLGVADALLVRSR